jgi:hypothetical protein
VTSVGAEEFEAELQSADMVSNARRYRLRAIELGRVERDVDRAPHTAAPFSGGRTTGSTDGGTGDAGRL